MQIGRTAEDGRHQDRDNVRGARVENVYLYQLRSDWGQVLGLPCVEAAPQPVVGRAWMAGRGLWICCPARDSEMTGEPIVQMDLRLVRRARSRRNLCSGGSARASQ